MLRNLKLDTKEKIDAFYDLKNLLSDPEYIEETQHSMGDFWDMSPVEWENNMGKLFEKAKQATIDGLSANSPEVQNMVDQWMMSISKNIHQPINKQFMEIFKEKVDKMYGSEKQIRYWEVLGILDPTSKTIHQATQLMIQGLESKMSNR